MAPETFSRVGGQSAVTKQPESSEQRVAALRALLSCPTYSIHATKREPSELKAAQESLPHPVPGAPGVLYCGWHLEDSYAATSYLILRPQDKGGNIMVDSPRYNPVLAKRIEALGGVGAIFLTHKDDVGDHDKWARHFGCPRVLHEDEVTSGTTGVEIKLTGSGPWNITGQALQRSTGMISAGSTSTSAQPDARASDSSATVAGSTSSAGDDDDDMVLIHTPGHSKGHVCLLHRPSRALLSGDHLCSGFGEPGHEANELYIYTDYNWYSVPLQLDNVAVLLQYDWLHVLPGHGRFAHFRDAAHRLKAVSELLQRHGHTAKVQQVVG